MKIRFQPLALIVSVAFVAVAVYFGRRIPFSQQWPLFEALRTTAAIIFAVIGAWLALVYPDRLKSGLRNGSKSKSAEKRNGRFESLLAPIENSTAILAVVLLIGILAPIVRTIPAALDHAVVFRGISYGLLVALTLWQVWTVVLTMIPASNLRDDIAAKESLEEATDALFSQSKKEK